MKGFIFGLIIGAAIAWPAGMNMGKGVPILTNPFADKPLTQQVQETAEKAGKQLKESTDKVITDTKRAIHDATKE